LLTNIAVAGALDFLVFTDKGKGEFPGDLRNGMFKWNESKEVKDTKRAIELNNGRAAQMGILGLMYHEVMTGEPYVLNAFLGYPTV
jgi:Chlorophyll A-B binding protein